MQEEIKNIFQKMPSNHYNAEKSSGKWTHELQQSKYNFRNMQGKMLLKCQIQSKRVRKRNSLMKKLRTILSNFGVLKKRTRFLKMCQHLRQMTLGQALSRKQRKNNGDVPGYKKIIEKFGLCLENIFNIEWVETMLSLMKSPF